MHSHSGRVMLDGISFFEDQILRVEGSPKIELKGMAQRHRVQFGSNCWDGTLTCSDFCVSRLCSDLMYKTVLDGQHGWKNAWDAEAEAARLGQSLHEWRAGRTSSEVSGQG